MKLINADTFVIEMREAVAAKNKQVMDDNEGLVTVPDGEPEYQYMWFAGVGCHPDNPRVRGAIWTPYPSQAHQYKDKDEADFVNKNVIGPAGGGKVISWNECHKDEGRQIVIPVIHGKHNK